MVSEPLDLIARHDPAQWTRALRYRGRSDLPFDLSMAAAEAPLMLDTTVYIDALKGKMPADVAALVASRIALHCSVACAEMAFGLGQLDPADKRTPTNRAAIEETLARIPTSAIFAPSADAWIEAGIVTGILARTQGIPAGGRRDLLNDALLFFTAGEVGAVLVSRNIRHMGLLLQLQPRVSVLLYDQR